MRTEFCPHFALAHETPASAIDCVDNVTMAIEYLESLMETIEDAEAKSFVGALAVLGEQLCGELRRRVAVLHEWHRAAMEQKARQVSPSKRGTQKGQRKGERNGAST